LLLTQLVLICMLGLIFYLIKQSRNIFIIINIVIISILAIINLIIPDYQLFGTNEVIYLPPLANADNIPMIGHGFTWWRAIADLTILSFVFSAYILLIHKLNSKGYKKLIVVLIGSVLILIAAIYDQFIDIGLIDSVYLLPFALFLLYLVLNFIPYLFLLEEVAENLLISQREKKWRNLVYDAQVIVVGLNRMGHVEFVNPYFLKLTGFREDEVLGKDWFEYFIPPKESYHVQGAFLEALASEFHPHFINPILTKTKEERIIRWYNVRTRDINDNITGSLSLGLDITDDIHEKEDLINKLKSTYELIDKLKKK
jgi:PAS domain S-box-containing protein